MISSKENLFLRKLIFKGVPSAMNLVTMHELEQQFKFQLDAMLGIKLPSAIAVMVSGGPDSMFLCYLANKFCSKNNIELHAVMVDHQLRQESTVEAEVTQLFLKRQGVRAEILPWHGEKPKGNIQALARQKRYQLVDQYCKKCDIEYVLTGHHKDDQAETVMLRIMRGSGVNGIAGMDFISKRHGIKLLRPMLNMDKGSVISCIKEIGWDYCQDPSNRNEVFERVKVRNLLANPTWEPLKAKLVLLADNAKRTNDYVKQQTEQFLKQNCVFAWGTASLNLQEYREVHEEIALRALSSVLMQVSGNNYSPRLTQLKRLYAALQGEFKNKTLWGCFIKVKQGKVLIMREAADIKPHVAIKAGEELVWDERFVITSDKDGYISTISKHYYSATLKPLLREKPSISPETIATLPAFFDEAGQLQWVYGIYEVNKVINIKSMLKWGK